MEQPERPKLYHIVHLDRLKSIVDDGHLFCDSKIGQGAVLGTSIGMPKLKRRRSEKKLNSYPDVCVGDCVPFYFCPRSVMLYVIEVNRHKKTDYEQMAYKGGQEKIVHLQADLFRVVEWAEQQNFRWVFTPTNATARDAEDYNDVKFLHKLDWGAVQARVWKEFRAAKQAEFLMEQKFDVCLIDKVGVFSPDVQREAQKVLSGHQLQACVRVEKTWYYKRQGADCSRGFE